MNRNGGPNGQVGTGVVPGGSGTGGKGKGIGRRRLLITWLLSLAALVAAIAALLISGQRTTPSGPAAGAAAAPAGLAVGDRAPDFRLADLRGTQVGLSQYRSKPVILHFWAVDCTTCRAEQPDYTRAIAGLEGKRPAVLAVDAWGESSEKIASYFGSAHLPGVALVDPSANVFQNIYKGQGIPYTFYIDARGTIRASVVGGESYDQIVANVKLIAA